MKETRVHLNDEEFEWVKSKGNNYLRHLVQLMMRLEVLFKPAVFIDPVQKPFSPSTPIAYKTEP